MASETDMRGAHVTIVEKRHASEPPWRSWPELISRSPTKEGFLTRRRASSPNVLNAEACAAGTGYVALSGGDRLRFD